MAKFPDDMIILTVSDFENKYISRASSDALRVDNENLEVQLRIAAQTVASQNTAQEQAYKDLLEARAECVNLRTRAEKAEVDLEWAKSSMISFRTEIENIKRMWKETIDDKVILRTALHDIATNANGAEYGLWANRKAERALKETEEK